MLINSYSEIDTELWTAADLVGAELFFRNSEKYRVTVHQNGHLIGATREKRNSREWVKWLRSLR